MIIKVIHYDNNICCHKKHQGQRYLENYISLDTKLKYKLYVKNGGGVGVNHSSPSLFINIHLFYDPILFKFNT